MHKILKKLANLCKQKEPSKKRYRGARERKGEKYEKEY